MSKFHSTVTRRDFMKGLGLAGAGLGAAAAAAPVYHDLDEAMAAPSASQKREWFIKELEFEKPTLEIDWDIYQRFDQRETVFGAGFVKALGQTEVSRLGQLRRDREAQHMIDNTPGYTLRDRAMYQSVHREGISASFLGDKRSRTPQDWGDRADPQLTVPKWNGTKEENSRMIRSVLKFRGAALVGFVELTANTKKLLFSPESRGQTYEFEDVDEASVDGGKHVIPNKAQWLISYAVPESEELVRRMPTGPG